jgi:glutathione S-transferase
MPTPILYHAPHSRSTRIVTLIEELGAPVEIRIVGIGRSDGSGGKDLRNPHPEGKVPLLEHDGALIWESSAIMLYLTDLFPEAGLGPQPGDPRRGPYLSWLLYYGSVVEPVMIFHHVLQLEHPVLTLTFRGVGEVVDRLTGALDRSPFLLGDTYSAADLIMHSPFAFFPDSTPDVPAIRDWVARCVGRPATRRAAERDAAWLAARSVVSG